MRLVNDNGGTYHRAICSNCADIIITENNNNSDKYQAAERYKKDILLPEWIFESVAKGFALPTKNYRVKALKVSTPIKSNQIIADFTSSDHTQVPEISRISTAGRENNDLTLVNEAGCSTMNDTQRKSVAVAAVATSTSVLQRDVLQKATSAAASVGSAFYQQVYAEICSKQAKKAGNFLDGCCIYLSGFRAEEREKLNRILNVGGATRYDVYNEKITHIILGQQDDSDFRAWKRDGLLSGKSNGISVRSQMHAYALQK